MQNGWRRGLVAAVSAYILWGTMPVYWKLLSQAGALEILAHRFLWSLCFLVISLMAARRIRLFIRFVRQILDDWRRRNLVLVASLLIPINWLTYVWAVNNSRIVETSLGYYINPLINVLFGVALLREKISWRQKAAVALAALGVLNLVWHFGSIPWVALLLATIFSLYGLCKKLLGLPAIDGLTMEITIVSPLALAYVVFLAQQGAGSFIAGGAGLSILLAGAGLASVLPLFLFSYAANRLPLSQLGFTQYLSPTVALLVGVILYHEPFTLVHVISFGLIWLALVLYSWR